MYSSLAQAFSSEGEGFALKGDTVPRSTDRWKVPQLTKEQAIVLGQRITSEYRERTGKDPSRIVLHKTTQFNEVERSGFELALKQIPVLEFVNIAPSDFRLVQRAAYPPKREPCAVSITKLHTYLQLATFRSGTRIPECISQCQSKYTQIAPLI
jgi:hypothetical protein